MGNDVFANGRELSCKAGSGKSICAFPDVCFTPPQTPATPPGVPIPYPNTGMASDTSKGSRDVKITKKEVMLKNKSMFKKSVGDQAGCAPKKGVVTSQTGGKVYFNSWSMDVKIEGENAVRHLDLTTHNHGSVPGNTPTWPYIDQMAMGGFDNDGPCKEDIIKEQEACAGMDPYGDADPCDIVEWPSGRKKSTMTIDEADGYVAKAKSAEIITATSQDFHFSGGDDPKSSTAERAQPNSPVSVAEKQKCLTARSCQLVPYKPDKGTKGCCKSQTPHHLIEAAAFFKTKRGKKNGKQSKLLDVGRNSKGEEYRTDDAPSICAFGPSQWRGSHGQIHTIQGNLNLSNQSETRQPMKMAHGTYTNEHTIKYEDARDNGIMAAQEVNPQADCDEACMAAQLDAYHCDKLEIAPEDEIKCVATGWTEDADVEKVNSQIAGPSSVNLVGN